MLTNQTYSLNSSYIVLDAEETSSLFDPNTSTIFHLNDTARFILKKIKSGKSTVDIVTLITKTYDVTSAKAEKDVIDCLSYLKKNKLIVLKNKAKKLTLSAK